MPKLAGALLGIIAAILLATFSYGSVVMLWKFPLDRQAAIQNTDSNAPSPVAEAMKSFSWRGISFQYPSTWHAEVWEYRNSAITDERQPEDLGFQLWKLGSTSDPNTVNKGGSFSFDYFIEAGGPQTFGDTCEGMRRGDGGRRMPYSLCEDLPVLHSIDEPPTIAIVTRSSLLETRSVFEEIISSSQASVPESSGSFP